VKKRIEGAKRSYPSLFMTCKDEVLLIALSLYNTEAALNKTEICISKPQPYIWEKNDGLLKEPVKPKKCDKMYERSIPYMD
jgi:hypothetical protein